MTTLFAWDDSTDSFSSTVGTAPTTETAGSYGERLKFAATTAIANARANITATSALSCRFIYTVASYASSSHTVMAGYATGTVQQFKVDLSPAGLVRIRDAAGTQVAQGVAALAAATEYDFKVIRSGSTLTVKVYLASNNTLVDTVTGTVGTADLTMLLFGNNAALTGTLGATTFDEIVVNNDSTEIGPPASQLPLTGSVVLSPSTGAPPVTITATFSASGGTGSYTFAVIDWGDGSSSPSQSSNVFTKSFPAGAPTGLKHFRGSITA